jgi:hypothetical protein
VGTIPASAPDVPAPARAIATFVERFDEMTPAEYEQWLKESGAKAGSQSH